MRNCGCCVDADRGRGQRCLRLPLRVGLRHTHTRHTVRPWLGLILLIAASTAVIGQDAVPNSGGDENKYTLSGTVVNSVTGAPVPRALVQIYVNGQRQMLTDADGRFTFSGLPEGQTGISAEKPGFFQEGRLPFEGGFPPPAMARMGPDAQPEMVKLIPESVIAGRILSNGQPVEDVPVKVIAPQIVEGRKEWTMRGSANTDEDGQFRVANLQAGDYYLEVGPRWLPGGLGVSKGHEAGYARTFYPSMPGTDAPALAVGTGQRTELELSIELEPWYRIHGAVRTTEATQNWNVQLLDEAGDREEPSKRNPETGEFETWAPAGQYTLRVMGFGQGGVTGHTDVGLTVNSDVNAVQVALGPEASIPVRVKRETTRTQEKSGSGPQTIQFKFGREAHMPPIAMWFRHTGFSLGEVPSVRPDASGKPETLAVRDLRPGTYWVDVGRNPPWYVESVECGDVDLLREPLTVNSGAPCSAIDVTLRDDGASLTVSAQWDEGPEQAFLLLMPEKAPQQALMSIIPRNAETEIPDLPPGAYSAVLVDHLDGLEYKNPEAMSGYLSKAGHMTLVAGQKGTVTVELQRR
jgi:hypothetical protein